MFSDITRQNTNLYEKLQFLSTNKRSCYTDIYCTFDCYMFRLFAIFRQLTTKQLQAYINKIFGVDKKNQLDVTFVFFISLLIVAQHVSGNHVPIIRS